ncbi:jg21984, partial [Pararge aegeria aegeria]
MLAILGVLNLSRSASNEWNGLAESASQPSPLRGVVWAGGSGDVRGGLAARLQLSETVAYMARAVRVAVHTDTSGELLLTDRRVAQRARLPAGVAAGQHGGAGARARAAAARAPAHPAALPAAQAQAQIR